jgi:serine/threonine protein kinase
MSVNEESVFEDALEIQDPGERAAFLDRACAHNPGLRRNVESLLAAYGAGQFLEAPAPALDVTVDEPAVPERPGTVLGLYKLLEQVGEGGFGVVFRAEQTQPVRRQVALKVLKPGMDTRQVVARFEAERQALALMDHPNIAKVFDGGEAASGRPYFVMELVPGVPITDFCDQGRLPVRERLELFAGVCLAVQHAHQKGIIHRDLKPSNVLVTLRDSTPVAKVIDFGIAKALGQQPTDKTLFTHCAQLVGTPLYMSPEQAQMSGLDIDTRTDIYALGVLLYELLTGSTPFEPKRLLEAGFDEVRRIIREEEPPRPSTRLSTSGQAAATVSANRRSDPKRLNQLFRGELDWIVMKALDKDRTRRYETASAFAADVQRYLRDEPVQACPPSAWYRCRKFGRRNKAALVTAAAVASLVLLAFVGLTSATLRTRQEKQRADENAAPARAAQARADESARAAARQRDLARETLETLVFDVQGQLTELEEDQRFKEQFADAGATRRLKKHLLGQALAGLQLVTRGAENAAAIDHATAAAHVQMGNILLLGQQVEKSRQEYEEGRRIGAALVAADPSDRPATRQLALAHAGLGDVGFYLRDPAAAREHYSRYAQLAGELAAAEPRSPEAMHDLAGAYQRLGALSEAVHDRGSALGCFRKGLELVEAWAAAEPNDSRAPLALLEEYQRLGNLSEPRRARPYHLKAVKLAEALLAANRQSPRVKRRLLATYGKLATTSLDMDDPVVARDWTGKMLGLAQKMTTDLPPRYQQVFRLYAYTQLVRINLRLGDAAAVREAQEMGLRVREAQAAAGPPNGPDKAGLASAYRELAWFLATYADPKFRDPGRAAELAKKAVELAPLDGAVWNTLGVANYRAGQWKEAVGALRKAMELRKGGDGVDWFFLAMARWRQGDQNEARKWYDQAVQWMEKNQPQHEELRRFRTEATELLQTEFGGRSPGKKPE